MPMTQEQQEVFLKQPEVAVISTIDEFGRPRSAPIWFLWEDGAAYMFTARRTLKWRNLQSRPYASLCVDKRDTPYSSVVMDGPVQEADRPLYELVLSMALRYYGEKKDVPLPRDTETRLGSLPSNCPRATSLRIRLTMCKGD